MMPASTLWQKLGATAPLFAVNVGGRRVDDNRLRALTLTRGAGKAVGVGSSTATIEYAGADPALSMDAAAVTVQLTDYGASLLVDLIGPGPADAQPIGPRWSGRTAGQSVTDTGDPREPQWVTTLTCCDLFRVVSEIGAGAQLSSPIPPRNRVFYLIEDLFTRSGVAIDIRGLLGPVGMLIADPDPSKNYSAGTIEGHFITDLGYLFRIRRDGYGEILDSAYRADRAAQWQTYAPQPLTRSAARTPAAWQQRVTMPAGVHWDQNNGVGWDVWISSNNPDIGAWPVEKLDMTDVYPGDGWAPDGSSPQLMDAMTARVYRSARAGYVLDTLTVDVLDLATRPADADRALCAQLLTAEPGDPVAISNDWPAPVTGVFTITQLTEKITARSWTLEVTLAPIEWATGRPSPSAAGRTWDTAYPRDAWWITPAASTTWDTAPTP